MDEFNSRVGAQRAILRSVNARAWIEPLFGLSRKSIERWIAVNSLSKQSVIVEHVNAAANELFFLANHSEDQVSDAYQTSAEKIADITRQIDANACG